ncbi:tRNA (adenosine(37)-N6)-threonylcarbamoyltransferase complex dimerization subunit type 1 TsaB [Candidatus Babeliales bacterium]|nr:tRNA (adenosine(37)-N6)-threonylcarbamoyltransferase complex dimerization subunit type 1 TsaB [Candidatus Babeliales bacterium]
MEKFLILQATYENVQFSLYNDLTLIESGFVDKMEASSLLMSRLCALLQKHALTFSHLAFIGASQGPAPFTTLRSMIATLNGIGFATKVPLVGCDGLEVFVKAHHTKNKTVALLNAFSGDIYYALYDGKTVQTGWEKPDTYIACLSHTFAHETFTFIGNAVPEDKKQGPDFPTLENIATACYEKYKKNDLTTQLLPLHMKVMDYKKSC